MELKFLTDEKLKNLSTQRLLCVLASARAVHSAIMKYRGRRCCDLCHEYIGEDWENDVLKPARPVKDYLNKIKDILKTRENLK